MLGTKASKAERQQLILNREAVRESDVDEEGGSGDIMSSSRLMLFPISLGLAAVFLWLAFTGIVVVSPGELAVVVTLVSLRLMPFAVRGTRRDVLAFSVLSALFPCHCCKGAR
jgi:hypothetical protein